MEKYKAQEERVFSLSVSGFALDLTLDKSRADAKGASDLLEKIEQLSVFNIKDGARIDRRDIMALKQSLTAINFDNLLQVRTNGNRIEAFLRDTEKEITDLLLIIHREAGGFTLLSISGRFNYQDLRKLPLEIEGSDALQQLPAHLRRV